MTTIFLLTAALVLFALPVVAQDAPPGVLSAITKANGEIFQRDGKIVRVRFSCHSHVTDETLAQIATLTDLEELALVADEITDAGLVHLLALPKLASLNLNNSGTLTDACVPTLVKLRGLRTLTLMRVDFTDAGVQQLAALQQLETLRLVRLPMTSAGLQVVQRMPNLRSLSLTQRPLSDADLAALEPCVHLTELYLGSCQASEPAISKLKAALPNTNVRISASN